eukprot:g2537.t1
MDEAHASSYTLRYFKVRGRAEPVRLILADSGLEWHNELLTFGTWPQLKRHALLGTVPTLGVVDASSAHQVAQCVGIAHYLATVLAHRGLLGRVGNAADLGLALSLSTCAYQELLSPLIALQWIFVRAPGTPLKSAAHAYYAKVLQLMPLLLRALGDKPYLCGAAPCVADYFLAEWCDCHRLLFARAAREHPDDVPPALVALQRRLFQRPSVAAYIADATHGRASYDRHDGGPLAGQVQHAKSPCLAEVLPFLANYEHDHANGDVNAGRASF